MRGGSIRIMSALAASRKSEGAFFGPQIWALTPTICIISALFAALLLALFCVPVRGTFCGRKEYLVQFWTIGGGG